MKRHAIRELELIDTKGVRSPDGGAEFLRHVPHLRGLVLKARLRRVDLTCGAGLRRLSSGPTEPWLALERYPGADSRPFARLPSLTSLWLSASGLTEIESLEPAAHLTHLRFLSLSKNRNIASRQPVAGLDRLETLWFHSSTNITEGRLEVLRGLRSLKDVRFQNRRHYSVRCEEFPPFGKR